MNTEQTSENIFTYKRKVQKKKKKNYRPVSISITFLKLYETYLHNCLTSFVNKMLSDFVPVYRKSFGSSHVLIRLKKDLKKSLVNENFVWAVLIDLLKTFDCIPHDLLITKMSP